MPRALKVIGGAATEMTAAPWDTHPEGEGIEFVDCTAHNCRHAGFQLRAPDCRITGGEVSHAGSHVWVIGDAHRLVIDGLLIQRITDTGSGSMGHGIRIAAGSAVADVVIKNPIIRETYYAPIVFTKSDAALGDNPPVRTVIDGVIAVDVATSDIYRGLVTVLDGVNPTQLTVLRSTIINATTKGKARSLFFKDGATPHSGITFVHCYTRGITQTALFVGAASPIVVRNCRRLDYADVQQVGSGISVLTKAGPLADADFPSGAVDGTIGGVDTTNHRLYIRSGGIWRYAQLTA
ncbi:hypothetical protein AC20117_14645 [Arthrobacter crystallopoietes]|nr:hypothetical protein AC20117_14645 [Arthrobacter crystallopoietes]